MKNPLKSKISHLFKGKPSKLEKFPTYDQSYKVEESTINARNIEIEKPREERIHKSKKTHKKAKTNLKLLDTTKPCLKEFPVLPSPITDPNESAKLTAQEFAKAVGIKILHRTDEEEDEDCDCEYCRTARSNLNTMTSLDSNGIMDNATPTQPIPNVSLNQYSVNTASISSSNNSTLGNNNENINIPPFPAFNFNYNDKLSKCPSHTSLNNTTNSNHSIVNSRTIGTPGYYCHRNRKNSASKVVDMSLFIPPTEQEIKSRVLSSSLSINSTPEQSSIQAVPSNEKIMGGSLDRNRNTGQKKTYYGVGITQSNSTRERSISSSVASVGRNNRMINTELKTSPIFKESSIGGSSRIQFKSCHRCDSGTELSNANANINPSSPNKRPYPSSLASSSSSTTLSSALSLTHISQPNLNSIASSQSSSQSVQRQNVIPHCHSLQSVKFSPKISNTSNPLNSIKSPVSSCSSVTPIKPHTSLKITRSVTISEGTRRAEIDVQPMEPDEIRVYTKGRFTITCEHSRRPSAQSFQVN